MNKRAMDLSVNTVIIIVLGLMILGIGLGLVRGVLGAGGGKLAQAVEGIRLDIPATSSDPVVVSNPLIMQQGDDNMVVVNFYNKGNPSCDVNNFLTGAWFHIDCVDVDWERTQMVTLDIPSGEYNSLGGVFNLLEGTQTGTYSCVLRVYCDQRDQRMQNPQGTTVATPFDGVIESKAIFVEVR